MSTVDVVIGAGPIGRSVIEHLVGSGRAVRVITRSGSGPEHGLVERVAADARDAHALRPLLAGAGAVHHCVHAPYSEKAWRRELFAAESSVLEAASGVVVFPESLYSYTATDRPMTEDGPRDARGGKRGVRTELLAARAASSTPTVSVVASDYFGPHARANAHAGERMVRPVLEGRKVQVLGRADQPHSFTYLPDLAPAMVAAADRRETWGSVLHAPTGPAPTQREMAQAFADAAGAPTARVGEMPGWLLTLGAAVPGPLRELAEMRYQFSAPFVMGSDRSRALLGLEPTPLADAARETVAWWRAQEGRPA